MKVKIKLDSISLYLIYFYIFFSYSSAFINKIVLGLSFCFIFVFFLKNKDFQRIDKSYFLWIFYVLFNIFSLFYTSNISRGISYCIVTFCIIGSSIFFSNVRFCNKANFIVLICFSSIHVIATFLQMGIPSQLNQITVHLLNAKQYNMNLRLLRNGFLAGITSQTSVNSVYITIFLMCVFCYIINTINIISYRKKIFLILIYMLSFYALISTGKRGPLLANLISILFLLIIDIKIRKKSLKNLFVFVIIIGFIIFGIINFTSRGQIIFQRFFNNDRILTGRGVIYEQIFNNFLKNPILGNGIASTYTSIDTSGHNIYLQLLNETGIVGVCIFILAVINSFINTIHSIFYLNGKNDKNMVLTNIYLFISMYYQIFFLVYGMSGNPLFDNYIFFMYSIAIAIPKSLKLNNQRAVRKIDENWDYNIS